MQLSADQARKFFAKKRLPAKANPDRTKPAKEEETGQDPRTAYLVEMIKQKEQILKQTNCQGMKAHCQERIRFYQKLLDKT